MKIEVIRTLPKYTCVFENEPLFCVCSWEYVGDTAVSVNMLNQWKIKKNCMYVKCRVLSKKNLSILESIKSYFAFVSRVTTTDSWVPIVNISLVEDVAFISYINTCGE